MNLYTHTNAGYVPSRVRVLGVVSIIHIYISLWLYIGVCRGVPPPACVTYVCRAHLFHTYVAGFVAAVLRCLEKEIRNPCSSKKGLVAKACRGGLSRRFVADCLSQAERLCYKPHVAERRPGASYIPRLLSRTHMCIYIYIVVSEL